MAEDTQNRDRIEEDEINLLDLAIVLLKRKRFIIRFTLIVAVITAVISLILPSIYRAETKMLPPQSSSTGMAAQILSQLGGAAGALGGIAPVKTSGALFIELLKSNSVLDRIIDRFDLIKLYKTKTRERARNLLLGALKAEEDKKSGLISVKFEDKDPKRAAQIANAFVEELKNVNKGLAVSEASQRRLFFEEQLQDVKVSLAKAEEDMKTFQEKTGVLQAEAQAKAVIENIALLRA
ncbi:MAG TPA: Wzz/FepE/Etk N-terminal domain-containing protein, partial [Syntrophorhabdaceae bacterium]|nr:Wzz/FepE/Etk N-terminal domain-containing protein [Syntrophorhabdaceae bacterium]